MLYSINDAMLFVGGILNTPNIVLSNKYKISDNDLICKGLEESKFYHTLYRVVYNLVISGAEEINEVVVDTFLQNYPKQYALCEQYDFRAFIPEIKRLASSKNIEYHYLTVRKFAMLRQYKSAGFDITELYDEGKDEAEQRGKLDAISIRDIDEYFESKRLAIKRNFVSTENIEHYKIGSEFMDTKETFKETPRLGLSFQSPYLNDVYRGIMGLTLRSGGSGSGKTTLSVGDACMSGVRYYYDLEQKKYITNKSYIGNVLFINTEMDLREELDVMFIAWISGVSRQKIQDGLYMHDEEERVDKAYQILQESGLYVVDNPEFTAKNLEEIIEDYILDKGVKLVVFDYIQNNGYVAGELAEESGIPMREDMVLLTITDRLKQMSRKHNVPILTGTQLNGRELELPYPDERCLAGGKSQVRKADCSMIITPLTAKQMDEIEPYLATYPDLPKPNLIVHSVKGRASRFPKYMRVYQYVDLGTGRTQDLYATTKTLEPLESIEKLKIQYI